MAKWGKCREMADQHFLTKWVPFWGSGAKHTSKAHIQNKTEIRHLCKIYISTKERCGLWLFFWTKAHHFLGMNFTYWYPFCMFFAIPQVYTYKKLALTSWGEFRWWFVQWFNANVTRIERVSASQSDPFWDKLSEIEQTCRMWKDKIELFKKSYPLKSGFLGLPLPIVQKWTELPDLVLRSQSFWTWLCRGVSFQCMASVCPHVPFQKIQVQKLPTSNLLGSRLPARNWCMSSRRARLFLWPTHTSREHLWRTVVFGPHALWNHMF